MDIHPGLGDATPEDVAAAHRRDLEVQDKYGVEFLTYWFNDPEGKSFCLVKAPDAESAVACHKESHGLMPNEIIEVDPPRLAQFMGALTTDGNDRALVEGTADRPDTALRVIMFTDIVGSTDISTLIGDDAAMNAVRTHDSIVRNCLDKHSGREVKHTGDGILASFTSVTGALDAALGIQEQALADGSVAIKIGLSAGEPVEQSSDIYGAAVNLAARICNEAVGGQSLVASSVRELAVGKHVQFRDHGLANLKGFEEPVHLFELDSQA